MWLAQQRQAKHFNLHHLADPNLLNSTVYCRRVHDVVVYDTLSVKERRLRKYLTSYIRNRALSTGKGAALWRRLGNPSIEEWGEYLRRHGGFYSFGEGNWINPSAYFADPGSMIIGNNVHITGGFFTCHDGSVNMINRAYKTKLDAVGPIRIFDDVFIGYGTIVLPGVSIGPRAVVGAGSVVSRDIPENSVAVGSPAKMVATLDAYIENLKLKNLAYPWRNLIEQRQGEYDPILEPRLQRMRTDHWFRRRVAGSF